MIKLVDLRLPDAAAERARDSHAQAIRELQGRLEIIVVPNLSVLVNNTIRIAHPLGRKPLWVRPSAVRFPVGAPIAAGEWYDYGSLGPNGEPIDRTRFVVIGSAGHTSVGPFTITFDLLVVG